MSIALLIRRRRERRRGRREEEGGRGRKGEESPARRFKSNAIKCTIQSKIMRRISPIAFDFPVYLAAAAAAIFSFR